jgi:hypothetical protein
MICRRRKPERGGQADVDPHSGAHRSGPYYSGPVVRFGFGGFHGDHGRWVTTAGRAPVIGNPGAWQGPPVAFRAALVAPSLDA